MSLTDTDLTVIEHLDFAPPCDRDTCDTEATWDAAYHGSECACPHSYLICDRCKDWTLEYAAASTGRVRCLLCGVTGQTLVIDRIEPL